MPVSPLLLRSAYLGRGWVAGWPHGRSSTCVAELSFQRSVEVSEFKVESDSLRFRTSRPRNKSFACLFSSPSDARTSQLHADNLISVARVRKEDLLSWAKHTTN